MDLVFQGYQRAKRFRVSRDRGFFPLMAGASKKFDVSKIQGFQG